MFDFFVRKHVVKSTQKFIDQLEPKVQVHVSPEMPLPSVRALKAKCLVVAKINALEEDISRLSDEELSAKTPAFKSRYQEAVKKDQEALYQQQELYKKAASPEEKETINLKIEKAQEVMRQTKKKALDAILPEAFAVTREVGKRVLSMRHFDVQMMGGMVLNEGNIAEMTTGEGKTLVATLPSYLNALTGEGVHVVTVNDYLAKRDMEWMGPIFEFLGLTIGVIQHDMMPSERQGAYKRDVVYGTNNEFGFDYLRDNMVNHKEDMVQRKHHFAVVDEVDSILIDEARTPLIISGPAEESTDKYYKANEASKKLKGRRVTEKDEIDAKHRQEDLTEGYDYMADEKAKSIALTDAGEEKAAQLLGVSNLHEMDTIEYRHHILSALRAKEFFVQDVDYVLRDGQVIIVDEFTGRMMPGRRWSDGLHQAVEAKEGIKIERENQTLATITFQNYFRLYEKLSGMTGTAHTEATEFETIYGLECVSIPTNKKLKRVNYPDAVYRSQKEKYAAVVEEIAECSKKGQPVLVGTISIERSELLARLLQQKGIEHKVLNAKYHEMEAHIIAQAGRYKGVTIATNMAGRGTDIVLGGNAEHLAQSLVDEKAKGQGSEIQSETQKEKFIAKFRQQVKEDQRKVLEAGGLYVLGTERHESRRIDNQLRGRQGRQGDPGASRFYVSLEDDLMRLFASDRIIGLMDKLGMEEGQSLEHPWLTKAIENAQRRVEAHNFEIRKHLLEYDNVMNRQREVIYNLRRDVLESDDVKGQILEAIEDTAAEIVAEHLVSNPEENQQEDQGDGQGDREGLMIYLKSKFNYDVRDQADAIKEMSQEDITTLVRDGLLALYAGREQAIDPEHLRHLEKMLLLQTIDAKWKDHLYSMDQLKEGINLRSFAQRDPLIEYKREGFEMFQLMYGSIHREVVEILFKIQAVEPSKKIKGVFSSLPQKFVHNEVSGLSAPAVSPAQRGAQTTSSGASVAQGRTPSASPIRQTGPKVGRNDPCSCGSGKKYKKCCGT